MKKKPVKKRPKKMTIAAGPVTTIVIQARNTIVDPGPLQGEPDKTVAWVVDNQDAYDHVVTIDPLEVIHRTKKKKENPFKTKKPISIAVAAGTQSILGPAKLNPKASFPSKAEPYKYAIESSNADGTSVILDPDLDVITP